MHIGCNVEGSTGYEQLGCRPCLWCAISLASPMVASRCTKEYGSKPFSRLHAIYLHLHCWHDKHKFLLQPSCVCHSLQGEDDNPLQDAANSFLDMAFPHSSPKTAYGTFLFCIEQILMHNLPLDLQSVGYFLFPQVQLGTKDFLH